MPPPQSPLDSNVVELLEADPRPAFVVDLRLTTPTAEYLSIAYANPALTVDKAHHDAIIQANASSEPNFYWWAIGQTAKTENRTENKTENRTDIDIKAKSISQRRDAFSFTGKYWTRSVFRSQWAVISANEQRPTSLVRPGGHQRRARSHSILQTGSSSEDKDEMLEPDQNWTILSLTSDQEESFVHVINTFDWASTPLGAPSQWSMQLQQTFNQILADSRPIAIYWGSQFTTLYNEAFSKLCGTKHPTLLGKPVEEAWPDLCGKLKQRMKSGAIKSRAIPEEEWCFFIEKVDGSSEETYLKWSIVPIMEKNRCVGFLHPVEDITSMRLWERRMKMLINLGEAIGMARDVKSYWKKSMEALEACSPSYDVPMAFLYSVESSNTNVENEENGSLGKICHLEGSLGVPRNHPIAPQTLDLTTSQLGLSSAFREALSKQNPTLISTKDGNLPTELLKGVQWRGFQDQCHQAIICPIRPTKEERVMGLLVLGLNPRRPYDVGYQQCIFLMNQKLTATLASVVLLEEEARRRRNIAEQAKYDEAKLKARLAVQIKETTESISKFRAVAEFIPVGMCFWDHRGNITFANDAWHSITGVPKCDQSATSEVFISRVVVEDRDIVSRAYNEIQRTGQVTIEFRIQNDDEQPLQHPIGSSPAFEKAGLDFTSEKPSERHIWAALKAECQSDGTIVHVLACLIDVTLHKRATEEAVRRAQQAENLKKMAEVATVGMYDLSPDGRLLGANDVFWEMCGIEKVDLSLHSIKPFSMCVIDEDLTRLQEALEKVGEEVKMHYVEVRLKTPWVERDSVGNKITTPRYVTASFIPVKTSEGTIETLTGCLIDTSRHKWLFDMERKRKDEALEAKRQQENFIDMVSHELRNPLSAIIQCTDGVVANILRVTELINSEDNMQAMLRDAVSQTETIDSCAQHARRIVDDILTMSKMDSNLLAIAPVTCDPIETVREVIRMFSVEARRFELSLTKVIDKSYHDLGIDYLDLDPSRLRQVLINLINNAMKFTKSQAERRVYIKVGASKTVPTQTLSVNFFPPSGTPASAEKNMIQSSSPTSDIMYLIFEVEDSGQGLTQEEMSMLFQRFVQASPKTHVKYGGSGLGLFICKRLVEMQNGAIGVASKPGEGSTFAFYIEARTPSEENHEQAKKAGAVKQALKKPKNKGKLKEKDPHRKLMAMKTLVKHILIVEDNLINQHVTRRGLVEVGYVVDIADNGEAALRKIQQTTRASGEAPLDVILMDVEMPIMDGLACTRRIRQMEAAGELKGGRIPILAVSANARMEQIADAKAAGCDDVLVKPFKFGELYARMEIVAGMVKGVDVKEWHKALDETSAQSSPVLTKEGRSSANLSSEDKVRVVKEEPGFQVLESKPDQVVEASLSPGGKQNVKNTGGRSRDEDATSKEQPGSRPPEDKPEKVVQASSVKGDERVQNTKEDGKIKVSINDKSSGSQMSKDKPDNTIEALSPPGTAPQVHKDEPSKIVGSSSSGGDHGVKSTKQDAAIRQQDEQPTNAETNPNLAHKTKRSTNESSNATY